MLRISPDTATLDTATTLRLAGRITGLWVDELRAACDAAAGIDPLTLDLSEVSFIDRSGLALLRDLLARGVRFTNCPLFAAEQLREGASCSRMTV